MAKAKNKNRVSAEKVQSKKGKMGVAKALNPFEVHVNKEKLKVLGKKQKNDRGLPGVSRAKAIEKRKLTLLQEYKVKDKSNHFTDRRIGEKNNKMTEDEKFTARFTAVRVKANKKNMFNLADDEFLTHRGQTLSEIEKFDDPRSDDEDSLEEGNAGRLEKDFVEEAHFGGGMLKKTGVEGAKSHKEVIDQLIADSKKRKAEKQKTKEVTLELTQKLDSEWKDLIPLVNTKKKTDQDVKSDVDDYDKIMQELKFEARGTVSDRLKTEEEIAREKKEKLESLEQERLERMRGFDDVAQSRPHRSADDLDDDFVTEDITENNMLSYNEEGQTNLAVSASINGRIVALNGNTDHNSEEDIVDSDKNELDCADNDGSDDSSDEESEDNFSDLKTSSDSEEETDEKQTEENRDYSDREIKRENFENNPAKVPLNQMEENVNQFTKLKVNTVNSKIQAEDEAIVEQAEKQLPFTYSLPETYECLQIILEEQPSSHQSIIIERMVKSNHPSLADGNKDGLGLLFAYILQYLNDLFSGELDEHSFVKGYDIFKALVPRIFELAQMIPESTHKSILEVMKEKHEEYRRKKSKRPGIEVLIFFKLVSILFPTSDLRHQIVTPCFIFMEQILTNCKIQKRCDIAYGFYVVTLVLEYTVLSKRYLPAALAYLSGLLHMAIPKSSVRLIKVSKPFCPTTSLLVLSQNSSLDDLDSLKMRSSYLVGDEFDEEFKIRILYNTVSVVEKFCEQFAGLSSNVEIFASILKYLLLIPVKNYPLVVRKSIENLIDLLKKLEEGRKLSYIVLAAAKPKALRLYEPKIEEVYEGKRHKVQSKKKAERSKLIHKLKKEKKGALREIRRDKAFLGRVKIKQKIQSDNERREKVKRIFSEAANQQSELNELDRKKKRKK